jgi:hypothetical protein
MNARLRMKLLQGKPLPPPNPAAERRPEGYRRPEPLADPVDWLETRLRVNAQSLLAGIEYADGSYNPGVLTKAQASDVMAWHITTYPAASATPIPSTSGWRRFFFTIRSKTV